LTQDRGYDTTQVDDLLRRVADELDAGRPAGPLIKSAVFREAWPGYEIDAVDWFLGQLLGRDGPAELTEPSEDPWRHLSVVNHVTRSGISNLAGQSAGRSPRALERFYAGEFQKEWHDFDQQPGVRLQLNWAGMARRELRTMDRQTIASASWFYTWPDALRYSWSRSGNYYQSVTINTDRRRFTLRRTDTARSWSPLIDEIAARTWRDSEGHFAANTMSSQGQQTEIIGRTLSRAQRSFGKALDLKELVDATGIPGVLYASGRNFGYRAAASITFPGRRWLRFLVRGNERWNAIMTAVDQAGNRVARYRIISGPGFRIGRNAAYGLGNVEIALHPGWKLTEERVLAVAISAPWLHSYFSVESGGGG
jgi:hypothetical protein